MARYHLDIRDDAGTVLDEEGAVFESLDDAVREAKKALHEMAADEGGTGNSAVAIDIRDATGSLMTVMASTSVVPNLRPNRD